MFKTVTVHVHNPTQAEYDSIPVPEEYTDDESLRWKAIGNVTVFQPRPDRGCTSVHIELKSYLDDEDYMLCIERREQFQSGMA